MSTGAAAGAAFDATASASYPETPPDETPPDETPSPDEPVGDDEQDEE